MARYEVRAFERRFEIHHNDGAEDGPTFYPFEFCPNGRLCRTDKKGLVTDAWDEPIIQETLAKHGPNNLISRLKGLVDEDHMVFEGGGYGIDSKYYPTLNAAVDAIRIALQQNKPFISRRKLSAEELEENRKADQESTLAYWKECLAHAQAAMADHGLFKGCHSFTGEHLRKETKERILAYINHPNQADWNAVRGFVIAGKTTLWQAWILFDRSAPTSGSVGFPNGETVTHALRNAVSANLERITDKVVSL